MMRIPVIDFKSYSTISRKEFKVIQNKAIKIWHFERSHNGEGIIPVKGEYDPTNPKHIGRRR